MLFLSLAMAAIPAITTPITDEAEVIDPAVEVELEAALRTLREATGVQMAVVTVRRIPFEHSIESFSLATAEAWGGGSGRDDGALLVFAIGDRRSRLELGYGLEGYITDAEAGAILERAIPDLRDDDAGAAAQGIIDDVRSEVSSLRPNGAIPPTRRAIALAGRWVPRGPMQGGWFALVGALGCGGFVLAMSRPKGSPWVQRLPHEGYFALGTLAVSSMTYFALSALVPVPLWRAAVPLLAGMSTAFPVALSGESKLLKGAMAAAVATLIATTLAAYAVPPNDEATMWGLGISLGWVLSLFIALGGWRTEGGSGGSGSSGGGSDWSPSSSPSSSSSSSSSGSSSSGSSGGSDWGGGGGGFGGGGASSGW